MMPTETIENEERLIGWIERSLGRGARVERIERALGATSSSVFFVDAARGGTRTELVARLFTIKEWLAEEPDLAVHEAQALEAARGAGLHCPRLLAYAEDSTACGAPAVLMSREAGSVELPSVRDGLRLSAMASRLAEIHASSASIPWSYVSWTRRERLSVPVWTRQPTLWRRALEVRSLGPKPYVPVFIHRDFHPVNLLWLDGRISAVVDWVNACLGPRGADVAHCMGNLALMFGASAADAFLDAYRAGAPGYDHDPYWNIDWILGTLPEPEYYRPWVEFGLPPLSQQVLKDRLEEHLSGAVAS